MVSYQVEAVSDNFVYVTAECIIYCPMDCLLDIENISKQLGPFFEFVSVIQIQDGKMDLLFKESNIE